MLASGRGLKSCCLWLKGSGCDLESLHFVGLYERRRCFGTDARKSLLVCFPLQPSRSRSLVLVLRPMSLGSRLISWSVTRGVRGSSEMSGVMPGVASGSLAIRFTTEQALISS